MTGEWDEEDIEEGDEEEFGPGSADYDLSEGHGYRWEDSTGGGAGIPQWLMVAVALLAIAGFLLPALLLIYRYG